jgi:L-amino acid N-acyltransferase YncA
MDVKTYYKRIRDTEATIPTPFAVVVSQRTDDGGKSGVLVEVARRLAAKMVVEGSAEVATAEQTAAFQQQQAAAIKAAEEAASVAKVEVTMVSSDDLKKLTEDVKKLKGGSKSAKE